MAGLGRPAHDSTCPTNKDNLREGGPNTGIGRFRPGPIHDDESLNPTHGDGLRIPSAFPLFSSFLGGVRSWRLGFIGWAFVATPSMNQTRRRGGRPGNWLCIVQPRGGGGSRRGDTLRHFKRITTALSSSAARPCRKAEQKQGAPACHWVGLLGPSASRKNQRATRVYNTTIATPHSRHGRKKKLPQKNSLQAVDNGAPAKSDEDTRRKCRGPA